MPKVLSPTPVDIAKKPQQTTVWQRFLGGAKNGTKMLVHILRPTGVDHVELAPANIDMAVTELGLASRLVGRDSVLKKAIQDLRTPYDFIIIDSPPALGMLTINSLVAADWVIIPTQPNVIDLRGLVLFRNTLSEIRDGNGKPKEMGILLTFFDPRTSLAQQAEQAMKEAGLKLFNARIGRSVKVAEAPQFGKSILEYRTNHIRAAEYRALAQEVLEWV